MAQDPSSTFTGHNFKSDYKFKVTQRQKANGEIQLEELSVRADEKEVVLETAFELLKKWYILGREKNIRLVSPYEKGYEPV